MEKRINGMKKKKKIVPTASSFHCRVTSTPTKTDAYEVWIYLYVDGCVCMCGEVAFEKGGEETPPATPVVERVNSVD